LREGAELPCDGTVLLGGAVSVQFVGLDVGALTALGAEEDRCGAGMFVGDALGKLVLATNGAEEKSTTIDGSEVLLLVGANVLDAIDVGAGADIGVVTGSPVFMSGELDGDDAYHDGCEIGYIQTLVGRPEWQLFCSGIGQFVSYAAGCGVSIRTGAGIASLGTFIVGVGDSSDALEGRCECT